MTLSGVSSSNYLAATSLRLHAASCGCTQCAAQRVETSPAPEDIQARDGNSPLSKTDTQLSQEEQEQVRKLQARDREVRQHEQAHLSAAGGITVSGPHYSYQRGPDGVSYAIGGEVNIDVSPGSTPQESLQKALSIARAALAPRDPSGADQAVAAQAGRMAQAARIEIAAEANGTGDDSKDSAERVRQAYQGARESGLPNNLISAYA
ncbi:hypothetical protein FNU76_21910 [Chitinimonas arctica]|uniref:Catalase n=2 Tax=Chitinimonas arctica TaxID=2594795 RepID=A0A516SMP0_9NEIS|nr:hypothetical protein FNU76_21910 [Chitinimonas arctica]